MKYSSNLTGFVLLAVVSPLWAATGCGDLRPPGQFGPYDYTDLSKSAQLNNVETHHFDANVENLVKGISAGVGADIGYTLKAFPNHHRALMAMVNLSVKEKKDRPQGSPYSIECWFDRAITFKPEDGKVRMVYGIYLHKAGRLDHALEQFQEADRLTPDNANINYNLGLLMFDRKNYAKAREHAKKAYDLGFPLPGLKNKLVKAGEWDERPAVSPPPSPVP